MFSLWELDTFFTPNDVIIAGAGFAGLWSAYHLKKKNPALKILIIEKELALTGASTRNAGFACFGSVTELMNDARSIGEEKMLELVKMRFEGISKIKKIFKTSDIDYKHFGGYELINHQQYQSGDQLNHDINWLNKKLQHTIRQKDVFRISNKKIARYNFLQTEHLVENTHEAQLHPGKLLQALSDQLQTMGVRIAHGIELKNYEDSNGKIIVHTNNPQPISTAKLLICTNASPAGLLPGVTITPARGQVLVTSPIENLPFKGTFHYDEGFYYFRNLGKRVLLGGARNMSFKEEQTTELAVSDTIQKELERFLREVILPGKEFTIEHRWSGIMGMAKDKFPIIKEVCPNCFCLVGLGGMGVALAPLAGEMAAAMLLDRQW